MSPTTILINKLISLNNYLKGYVHSLKSKPSAFKVTIEVRLLKSKQHILSLNVDDEGYFLTTPYFSDGSYAVIPANSNGVYDFFKIFEEELSLQGLPNEVGRKKLYVTMHSNLLVPKSLQIKM